MATYDNWYSRLVGWLKIILPLGALGLLSSLFLFNFGPGGDDTIPFAEIEELAREQRISSPYFAGVAEDGSIVTIAAASARPDGTGALEVVTLSARVEAVDGSEVTLAAGTGAILKGGQSARLDGLVRMETSSGYQIETEGAIADIITGRVETIGPLEARGPIGSFTAGHLVVENPAQGTGGTKLHFTEGVRLVYQPGEQEP